MAWDDVGADVLFAAVTGVPRDRRRRRDDLSGAAGT